MQRKRCSLNLTNSQTLQHDALQLKMAWCESFLHNHQRVIVMVVKLEFHAMKLIQ